MVLTILALGLFTITCGLASSYWITRKQERPRAEISRRGDTLIFSVFATLVAALVADWKSFALETVNAIFGTTLVAQSTPFYSVVILSFFGLLTTLLIYNLTNRRIKSYSGPIYASDEIANIPSDQDGFIHFLRYREANRFLKVNGRKDVVLVNKGEDPNIIRDPVIVPQWRDLAMSLISSMDSDIQGIGSEWSSAHHAHVAKKVNYANKKKSTNVIVWPLSLNLDDCEAIEIIKKFDSGDFANVDQYFFCIDTLDYIDRQLAFEGSEVYILSKSALVRKSINLDGYCKHLIYQADDRERLRLNDKHGGGKLTLSDTFTDLRVSPDTDSQDGYEEKYFSEALTEWLEKNDRSHLALLGEFGQGKSSLLLHYASRWARQYLSGGSSRSHERVPLLIELRARSPMDSKGPEDLLGEWGGRFGLSGIELMNLIQAGCAILVFEGFDEVRNAARDFDRHQHFNALWQFAFDSSKIIFTGRPNFFLGENETRQIMRADGRAQMPNSAHGVIWRLKFFNRDEMKTALRKVPKTIANGILELADKDEGFFDIAKRPSMLPVVTSQWDDIRSAQNSDTEITSSLVLQKYIDAVFLRKELEGLAGEEGVYQAVHWKIRSILTDAVAAKMLVTGGKNSISEKELFDAVAAIYPRLDEIIEGTELGAEASASWRYFKEKAKSKEEETGSTLESVRILAHDVHANGLLAPDPSGGTNHFYFPHKQFYEFILSKLYLSLVRTSKLGEVRASKIIRTSLDMPSIRLASRLEPMVIFHFAMGMDQTEFINPEIKRALGDKSVYRTFYSGITALTVALYSAPSKVPEQIVHTFPFLRKTLKRAGLWNLLIPRFLRHNEIEFIYLAYGRSRYGSSLRGKELDRSFLIRLNAMMVMIATPFGFLLLSGTILREDMLGGYGNLPIALALVFSIFGFIATAVLTMQRLTYKLYHKDLLHYIVMRYRYGTDINEYANMRTRENDVLVHLTMLSEHQSLFLEKVKRYDLYLSMELGHVDMIVDK